MLESTKIGPLAQLAEQGPFKPLVTGSSPVRLTATIYTAVPKQLLPIYGGFPIQIGEPPMSKSTLKQGSLSLFLAQEDDLLTQITAFLVDRRAQRLSSGTLAFYRKKLKLFSTYSETPALKHILDITPNDIREYLLWLEEKGHNQGGVHACYRALHTFLYWWEAEIEPEGWKNPIRKVRAPRVDKKQLEPADMAVIKAILKTCSQKTLLDTRDKAIFLFLMDTGLRASEFLALNLADCDYVPGAVKVIRGKGGKPRTVFVGGKTRRSMRAYLRERKDIDPALWVSSKKTRISYFGLRSMVARRAREAKVEAPTLHSFRRLFALQCLRAGMDIFILQKAMGHADLTMLRRYLAQTSEDVQAAHRIAGPVDNADW